MLNHACSRQAFSQPMPEKSFFFRDFPAMILFKSAIVTTLNRKGETDLGLSIRMACPAFHPRNHAAGGPTTARKHIHLKWNFTIACYKPKAWHKIYSQ